MRGSLWCDQQCHLGSRGGANTPRPVGSFGKGKQPWPLAQVMGTFTQITPFSFSQRSLSSLSLIDSYSSTGRGTAPISQKKKKKKWRRTLSVCLSPSFAAALNSRSSLGKSQKELFSTSLSLPHLSRYAFSLEEAKLYRLPTRNLPRKKNPPNNSRTEPIRRGHFAANIVPITLEGLEKERRANNRSSQVAQEGQKTQRQTDETGGVGGWWGELAISVGTSVVAIWFLFE